VNTTDVRSADVLTLTSASTVSAVFVSASWLIRAKFPACARQAGNQK